MKPWYQSRTVVFNVLTIASMIAAGLGGVLPALGPVLTVEQYQILLFSVGAANVVLRAVTTGPINWKKDVNKP